MHIYIYIYALDYVTINAITVENCFHSMSCTPLCKEASLQVCEEILNYWDKSLKQDSAKILSIISFCRFNGRQP